MPVDYTPGEHPAQKKARLRARAILWMDMGLVMLGISEVCAEYLDGSATWPGLLIILVGVASPVGLYDKFRGLA